MLCNLPQRKSLPSRRNLLTGILYRFKRFNVVLGITHLSCNNTSNNSVMVVMYFKQLGYYLVQYLLGLAQNPLGLGIVEVKKAFIQKCLFLL